MNYQKVDTALAIALDEVEDPEEQTLSVFVHTKSIPNTTNTANFLENLGVRNFTENKNVFTATLSPNAISELSEQPWVDYLKLSQKLRLVGRR